MTSPDVQSVFANLPTGPKCWREKVNGEALAFIEEVEAHMKATGNRPVWTRVADALRKLGLEEVNNTSVGRHYLRRCKCP